MDKFLMICYVSADFNDRRGSIFRVGPKDLGNFIEAPVWIKDTLLFKWLVNDGSIKVAEQTISKKEGENDPMKGVSAEGKAEEKTEAHEAEVAEKPKATRKRAKKDDA